jgi:hypothetical protein
MSTLICPRASLALGFGPRRPRVALLHGQATIRHCDARRALAARPRPPAAPAFRAVPPSLRSGSDTAGNSRTTARTARRSPQRSTGSTAWPSRSLTHCSTSTPKRCRGSLPARSNPSTSETHRATAIEHLVIATLLRTSVSHHAPYGTRIRIRPPLGPTGAAPRHRSPGEVRGSRIGRGDPCNCVYSESFCSTRWLDIFAGLSRARSTGGRARAVGCRGRFRCRCCSRGR